MPLEDKSAEQSAEEKSTEQSTEKSAKLNTRQNTKPGPIKINTHPNPRTASQKSASRNNGAKTHGPITPEGKRKSARNSFRHGLLAKAIVFEGESREQFAALLKAFCDELQPQTPIEDLLVQKMAVNHWRQERIWAHQKTRASQETANHDIHQQEPRIATHMNVTEMRYDRQFDRALDRLLQYRATRENPTHEASEN